MKTYIDKIYIVSPLEQKDAFHGGRTEAFTPYGEVADEKKIKYYDVTSLYPFINKTRKRPLGHPTNITENFGKTDQYEGLIKCKVLLPRGLLTRVFL